MVDSNIVTAFDLEGDFPKLFWKYRPKDMDLNTHVKVIIESWIVNRQLTERR